MTCHKYWMSFAFICGLFFSFSIQLVGAQSQSDSFFAQNYKQALGSAQQDGRPAFVELTEHG